MTRQLFLLDPDTEERTEWPIDHATREMGLTGIATARAALAQATARAAAARSERQPAA